MEIRTRERIGVGCVETAWARLEFTEPMAGVYTEEAGHPGEPVATVWKACSGGEGAEL